MEENSGSSFVSFLASIKGDIGKIDIREYRLSARILRKAVGNGRKRISLLRARIEGAASR